MSWRPCAVVLTALCATAACDAQPHHFPLDFERMRQQPRYDPYARSQYFADGMAMRRPPDGTVPVEQPTGPEAVLRGTTRGALVDAIPLAVTHELMLRGRNRYQTFCRPCHDVDGSANSPVARNMQLRQPPSLLSDRIRALRAGRIFVTITAGYGLMPSYAHQLPPLDRWSVVAYVRALQLSAAAPLNRVPPDVRTEAEQRLAAGGRP